MEIGDRWARERGSAMLGVPSAISPDDTSFLLNPEHEDFKRIRIHPPIDYEFDPRFAAFTAAKTAAQRASAAREKVGGGGCRSAASDR